MRRLSDEACKELGYTRTRGIRRCGSARIPSCAKSHDKYTHVWRSTIITIGSEEEEEEAAGAPSARGEGGVRRGRGSCLAGNRYIHTRNRVTLSVHLHAEYTYRHGLEIHTRGAAGAHRLTGLHK